MASKTTLNATNLEALGAERLAALLIEISSGNANAKRRLRMELAAVESPAKLVHEIRKRLVSIANARTFIGWRSLKAFVSDLDNQRRLIAGQVAAATPGEALELMWTLIGLGNGVLERTTDPSGEVIGIFRGAVEDVARIAEIVRPGEEALVEWTAQAISGNGYGQNDGLIGGLAGVLGRDGLLRLRERLATMEKRPDESASGVRRTSRWRRGRRLERGTVVRRAWGETLRQARLDIADALGDVDAYIALQPDIRLPATAARVADRLVVAGRAEEALGVLDAVRSSLRELRPVEWQAARIKALEALGRHGEAQDFRLRCFHQTLNRDFLRAYLRGLPDFDDVEAEDAALDFAAGFGDVHVALDFFLAWPGLDHAARMVVRRIGEIEVHDDALLMAAADKLATRYPLAAVLLLRKLVEAALNNSRTVDYERAADQLSEAGRLAARVTDWQGFEDHEAYVKRLRAHHGRKEAFWAL